MRGVVASLLLSLAACSTPNPQERVTGSGGTVVKYSSRQTTVDLTAGERSTFAAIRDRDFPNASVAQTLRAVETTLTASGYGPLTTENDTGLVQGGRSEVLIPKWRAVLRGVLKTRVGLLPAKPDHQYTTALVTVRASAMGPGVAVRVRFDNTLWDSGGDSQTKIVLAKDAYDHFFARVKHDLDALAVPAPKGGDALSK